MTGSDRRIETRDGAMATFVAHPDDGGPFPVVVVYMDALGLRDELRGIGRRVAAAGYLAVVPDLYHRFGEGLTFDASKLGDPESGEFGRMMGTAQRLSDDMAMEDTRAVLEHLEEEPMASGGGKGCVGFCLGGRLAVRAMTTFPEQFVAGSALHPSFVVDDTPTSPHLSIGDMRAELYVGLGAADQFQPPETFGPARAELERHGVAHRIETHARADHGFMIPGAPAFQEEAAERSWERTFDLFRRTLQPAGVGS
jgi:carboxymethylenebutenolidase